MGENREGHRCFGSLVLDWFSWEPKEKSKATYWNFGSKPESFGRNSFTGI